MSVYDALNNVLNQDPALSNNLEQIAAQTIRSEKPAIAANPASIPVAPASRNPSVYGAFAYDANAADRALDQSINDMLHAQYEATERRRTDAAKLAKVAALGNVLQTAFAPLGWIGQNGATSQVAAPDSRQYITAFNEALKAQQDLGNIGANAAQMRLNIANRRAERAYNTALQRELLNHKLENQKEYSDYATANDLKKIESRGEQATNLQGMKGEQKEKDAAYRMEYLKTSYGLKGQLNDRTTGNDITKIKAKGEETRKSIDRRAEKNPPKGSKKSPTGSSTKKKSPTA